MCRAVPCKRCGKTTWAGCGQHVDRVLRSVPKSRRCACPPPEPGAGFSAWFGGMLGRSKTKA